jgi:hypothetical protein
LTRSKLTLDVSQVLGVVTPIPGSGGDWQVAVIGYQYTFAHPDAGEVIAYHWHQSGVSGITTPHIHIGPAATGRDAVVRPGTLHKAHFPSGAVSLESVLRLAIIEFDAEPRRDDWASILS